MPTAGSLRTGALPERLARDLWLRVLRTCGVPCQKSGGPRGLGPAGQGQGLGKWGEGCTGSYTIWSRGLS